VTELAARLDPRAWPRVSTVVALAALLALGALYLRTLSYRGETMPGTRVAGVDVGGLDRGEAASAIQDALAAQLARPVLVKAGHRSLRIEPRKLFALNLVATTEAALSAGRHSEPERIAALLGRRHVDVAPTLVLRAEAADDFLRLVQQKGGRPPRSATVSLAGLEPVVRPERHGLRLDREALLASMRRAAVAGGGAEAVFEPARPRHLKADAQAAAAEARVIVSQPVAVYYEQRPLRMLSPEQLAKLVVFEERGSRYLVTLDEKRLARVLDPALADHERRAVNARFEIDGDAVQVVPAQPGIALDADQALDEVVAAAYSRDVRAAEIRLHEVPAEITTDELAALGITRRMSSFTTDMGVSSSNRIWNVHLMADYIDGTIIRPGEVFSFNRVVGERTVERGFREGQMILGSLLLPSIGGGVCQTATTLFNNAFELGLPVLRRYNHSFYISHYPLGRDATVSWGGPDLVFKNDLDHAILIKSSYTDSTLTFTFFGAPQGRRVVATTTPKTNWTQPQTSYAYDPYAPSGSIRTSSGTNALGFDVTVRRTVYENDRLIRRDAFSSRYVPVGPTMIYGPGTSPPRIDFVLPPPGE
jgi:vancomycin resistance protein YoaR